MKRIGPIVILVAILAAYHTAGIFWGISAKLFFLIGMLALWAVLTLALFIMRRRLLKEQPELAVVLDSDSGPPWQWKLLDGVLGINFAIGPPIIVSLVRKEPLAGDGEFTGYHLLAMAGGVGVYLISRAYVVRKWQQRHKDINGSK